MNSMKYIYPKMIHRPRGFTLVELMVALVIVSLLTSIIYGLFIRTSDSMNEVDSLADTINKARFALEHVRNDVQAAGSQGSPNSLVDPNVRPLAANRPVMGIIPYTGWQDQDETVITDARILEENPNVSFDGFIVLGAYDHPQAFQVGNLQPASVDIGNNERGVLRMIINNPFFVGTAGAITDDRLDVVRNNMEHRLLRITDRDGFNQYIPILSTGDGVQPNDLRLTFAPDNLKFRQEGQIHGIEPTSLDDERYEAALLDAYWYRVVPVAGELGNYALVRERINAGAVLAAMASNGGVLGAPPASLEPPQRMVITDRVVDFQVWFDCASTMGVVESAAGVGIAWNTTWVPPDGSVAPHNCVAPAASPTSIQRARVAHVRLSLRTENERANLLHLKLGAEATWGFGEDLNAPLQTFDMAPDTLGAASVVTLQTSVELTNFAIRGLR